MSSQKYARPLVLEPVFSFKLFVLLLSSHLLALLALFFPVHLHWTVLALLMSLVFYSAWNLLYKNKITDIQIAWWKSHDGFEIELNTGKKLNAVLLPGTVVTEWLVILYLKCNDNKKRYMLLMDDALEEDIYRQLCVRLRQFTFDMETEPF